MIVSVTVGWAGLVARSISKPLLTFGLAATLFVAINTIRATVVYFVKRRRGRKAAFQRIAFLSQQVDSLRSRHFKKRRGEVGWSGIRKFRVSRKEQECDDCYSIYLTPCDGKSLPPFLPGQYLTFALTIPGIDRQLTRCYSLSDSPGKPYYRCTIKKVPPAGEGLPPGQSSTYFVDTIQPGDIVDVKAPRGKFYLDTEKPGPVVFLAGGVGITPVLSMLNTLLDLDQQREIRFFLAVKNSRQHMFRRYLETFRDCANRSAGHANIHVYTVYSAPLSDDELGRDYDFRGRVTTELLNRVLPSNNYDYFMCGPNPFMDALERGLQEWGVPKERIHLEAFGGPKRTKPPRPASVAATIGAPSDGSPSLDASGMSSVEFASSHRTIEWKSSYDSLLDLAEENGIDVESGCRAGSCGTCALAVKSGTVTYADPPDIEPDAGMCLPCIATPNGVLVLDA